MHSSTHSRYRFIGRVLMGTALATLLTWAMPTPGAWAHHPLEGSTPAAGAHLEIMPEEIVLNFTATLQDGDLAIVLADDNGGEWAASPALRGGREVSAAVPADLPAGRYELRWRVLSVDGAPLSGVVPFSVGELVGEGSVWRTVITAQGAARIRGSLFVVFSALGAYIAYGLVTVYGCGAWRRSASLAVHPLTEGLQPETGPGARQQRSLPHSAPPSTREGDFDHRS